MNTSRTTNYTCDVCGTAMVERVGPCPSRKPGSNVACAVVHLQRVCPRAKDHTALQELAALQPARAPSK